MKNYLIVLTLFIFSLNALSQIVVDSPEYNARKASNALYGQEISPNPQISTTIDPKDFIKGNTGVEKTNDCNCYVEPDGSYSLAMTPNDDGSSSIINIPFNFCFYGQNYNQLYINNNGNVTFENDLFTFTPNAFPSNGDKIIAPFWGDVDTRGVGQVLYKITPTAIYVNWVQVGYYNSETDLQNTFQLILTDGTDPAIADGNIAFCYKDMQWTTGAASDGVGGFGGSPATAGANKGDDISYFMVAQFDHPGNDFDGALGNADGISWLDNKSFYFNICNSTNIPPIAEGVSSCDTFRLCALSDTANIQIKFLSPELDQTTTLTYTTSNGLVVTEIENIPGNTASIILQAIALPGNEGYHTVTVTATDDFVPAGVTNITFTIFVDPLNGGDLDPEITPLQGCTFAELSVLNGPYDSYLWDDLTVLPNDTVNTTMTYGVTVSRNGCFKRVEALIDIENPFVGLEGFFFHCPGGSTTTLAIPDSTLFSAVDWNLGIPARDTMFINSLTAGTYTVSVTNLAGNCSKDTTFTITTQPNLVLENDFVLCEDSYTFTNNIPSSGSGIWTFTSTGGNPTFSANDVINPTINFPSAGVYTLTYTDENCPSVSESIVITKGVTPQFGFTNDFFHCPNQLESMFLRDSLLLTDVVWDPSLPALNDDFSVALNAGTYDATITNAAGCFKDTTFTIISQPAIVLDNYADLCGLSLNMTTNTSVPFGSWSMISGPSTPVFGSTTSINTTINVTQYGNYVFKYSENNCQDADTLTISFLNSPTVSISDAQLCEGAPYTIIANTNDTPSNLVWSNNETGNSITVTQKGTYTVTSTNICGTASSTAVIDIRVCDIDFPNVFTPSTDNVNNLFKVLVPTDGFKSFECQIFNRWGNLVYEYSDIFSGWDGKTTNGKECSPGTYFYKATGITYNGEELNYNGVIQLVRE
ncbi:MAG: nidogen-like domain-containing protein [Flavobacteriia bacterium]|jgi:gliding motility-associated-like protein